MSFGTKQSSINYKNMAFYEREQEELAAPGEIYRHYKGGIYRLVAHNVTHSETGEKGVVYEHLWPHEHSFFYRPQDMFFGTLPDGRKRFERING